MNDFIDNLLKVIAAISFASIGAFVAHEWAYFQVIGPSFLLLFTTYDFISNSIMWVVPFIIAITPTLFIILIIVGDDPYEIFGRSLVLINLIKASPLREVLIYSTSIPILIILALIAILVNALILLGVVASIIFVFAIVFAYFKFDLYVKIPISILLFFAITGAIIIFCTGLGHDRAYAEIRSKHNIYKIKSKKKENNKEIKVLRIVEKGIIVLDRKSKRIEFIPLSLIEELTKKMPEIDANTLLCSWFSVYCK